MLNKLPTFYEYARRLSVCVWLCVAYVIMKDMLT